MSKILLPHTLAKEGNSDAAQYKNHLVQPECMLPVLLTFLTFVLAQKVGLNSILGYGCWNAAFKYDFGCPVELPYYGRCHNDAFLTTVLCCINQFGEGKHQIFSAYKYVGDQCHYWGNSTRSFEDLNRTFHENVAKVAPESQIVPGELHHPVNVTKSLFDQQIVAATCTKAHYRLGQTWGAAMLSYWGLVTIVATAINASRTCGNTRVCFGHPVVTKIRKLLTLPALMGHKHHIPYRLLNIFSISAPTRGQSFIILGFIVLNLVAVTTKLDISSELPLMYVENSHKVMRYLANRTGIIAFNLLPLTVLFACRNNPLIFLTGWNFQTFQLYHRWCARMMALHAAIHAALITCYSARENVLLFKWKYVYNWPAGNLALWCMLLMLLMAFKNIRSKFYEWFLITHQILFATALICLLVHVSDYGWQVWPLVTLGIYVLEYSMRIFRMLRLGWIHEAHISLAGEDYFRMKVPLSYNCTGSYVYVRLLSQGLWWQSHPFSAINSSDGIELIVKAKNGLTGHILRELREKDNLTKKVIIEGPYGHGYHLQNFKSLLIFAGGVGITGLFPHAACCNRDLHQQLCIVWVLKNETQLEVYKPEIDTFVNLQCFAQIHIYLTAPEKDHELEPSLKQLIHYGRPKLDTLFLDFVKNTDGPVAVCACGPPSFVDTTRAAVVKHIEAAETAVEYFEEGFSW